MARKKITLELTIVEAQHIQRVILDAQDKHHKDLGRLNRALTTLSAKVRRAIDGPAEPGDGD